MYGDPSNATPIQTDWILHRLGWALILENLWFIRGLCEGSLRTG